MSADVVLRAASGPAVGLGHAMRSRAVAQALGALGARARVVVDDRATAEILTRSGVEAAAEDQDRAWRDRPVAGAWLDGFRDWTAEIAAVRARGGRALLAENRTSARERADLVVYPAPHYEPDAWDRAHAERVRGGAGWVPLAREVLALAPAGERQLDLIVSFGGSDPHGLTERALDAIASSPALSALRVEAVIGPHFDAERPRRAGIERRLAALPRAAPIAVDGPLAAVLARARVAVTALGTTLHELAWLGVPALVLANYAADAGALDYYRRRGPHRPIGLAAEMSPGELRAALEQGFASASRARVRRLPDLGKGAARIARELLAA